MHLEYVLVLLEHLLVLLEYLLVLLEHLLAGVSAGVLLVLL